MTSMPFVTPTPPPSSGASWLAYDEAFSATECMAVSALAAVTAGKDAGLVDGRASDAIRRTRIHWLAETPETAWVYDRLTRIVARANREAFGYALTGFDEEAQVGSYRDGGFYDWHVDRGGRGAGRSRKLTVSVQLTDPTSYNGGMLELNTDGRVIQAPRQQGTAVVFPAYALHRVCPVTDGLRQSLVIWMHGPDFV